MLTDLADVLRAAGLTVIEVDGWKTRGVNGWRVNGPCGGLLHHTATPASAKGDYPTLRIVRDGRSDLQGPLAQLGLGRSGTWYVVAAGYCNHAGPVDDPDFSNARAIAVEAENPGDRSTWPTVQYASYVKGCAALGEHYGIIWRGHKEAAVPHGRKTDPNFDCAAFRKAVTAANRKPTLKPVQLTDDMEDLMAPVTFTDANKMTKLLDEKVPVAKAREMATVTYSDGTAALAGVLSFVSSILRDMVTIKAELAALKTKVR